MLEANNRHEPLMSLTTEKVTNGLKRWDKDSDRVPFGPTKGHDLWRAHRGAIVGLSQQLGLHIHRKDFLYIIKPLRKL